MNLWAQLTNPTRTWTAPTVVKVPVANVVRGKRVYSNPWNLTEREATLMDALIERETDKAAAQSLSISPRTAEAHIAVIRKKMGHSKFRCMLEWDRWSRAKGGQ